MAGKVYIISEVDKSETPGYQILGLAQLPEMDAQRWQRAISRYRDAADAMVNRIEKQYPNEETMSSFDIEQMWEQYALVNGAYDPHIENLDNLSQKYKVPRGAYDTGQIFEQIPKEAVEMTLEMQLEELNALRAKRGEEPLAVEANY
jgi:hypothetical protein